MLAHQTQKNLTNAREYFREHLRVGDYYSVDQQVGGQWFGTGAERLKLAGDVREEDFVRLCDNQHPATGERLTVRNKTGQRRIFEDFVFSPSKSVSVAALIAGDIRVIDAHKSAVKEALRELEQLARCRVRKGKSADTDEDRVTGNIVASCFIHDSSRALDPQLHTHCIVFNATWDQDERRWKALQNYGILRDRKFLTEVYRNRLAAELARLGYVLDDSANEFQIRGIPAGICERFSKRREQIKTIADAVAQTHQAANINEIRDHVAHTVRDRKMKEISRDELQSLWEEQLSASEKAILDGVRAAAQKADAGRDETSEAFAWSIAHVFERKSVVRENELFTEALTHARGHVSLDGLRRLAQAPVVLRTGDGELTTRDVLQKEWEIVCWAREAKGAFAPLNAAHSIPQESTLSAEQRAAVDYLLTRPDGVLIFRGGAGTGKSFTLQEVKRGLDEAQRNAVVLAPQRKQVMALQADGFAQAQTVARFLQDARLAKGSALIIDEAGLLSVSELHRIMQLARQSESRVILSGDTRQHSGVEAGDALRAIEQHSGVGWVSLETIQRQKEWALQRQYRRAIKALSEGRFEEAFTRLASAEAIVESPASERYQSLAANFLAVTSEGRSCLVVSPTWREIHLVTDSIRAALVQRGNLGAEKHEIQVLENLDLTAAQKSGGAQYYQLGCCLAFHRKIGRVGRNSVLAYAGHRNGSICARDDSGKEHLLSPADADHFSVMRKRVIEIRAHESLLIKANAESRDGRKLANGELVQVAHVAGDGAIQLKDGRIIPPGFRQFTHGYAVTSHASQGLTVDHVLLAIDSESGAAVNRKQFYVSASRGRHGIKIYTDDAEALERQISKSGHRPLALDVIGVGRKMRLRRSLVGRILRRPIRTIRACARLISAASMFQSTLHRSAHPTP